MTRVMIIGNAGGGKSRLARALAARHGLPRHELDRMLWRPGWTPTPAEAFRAEHAALIAEPRWVIDGYGPWDSVAPRLAACDTVVLVDLPLRVHLWWAAKRQLRAVLFGREDGPDGCPMWPVTARLFRMMLWLHREARPKLLAAVEAAEGHARVIRLRSVAELRRFVADPV